MTILASIWELWHGQSQNGVIFYFYIQFDLEGQGQSPHNTTGILASLLHLWFKFGDSSLNG